MKGRVLTFQKLSEKEEAASQHLTFDDFSIPLNELTDASHRGICL